MEEGDNRHRYHLLRLAIMRREEVRDLLNAAEDHLAHLRENEVLAHNDIQDIRRTITTIENDIVQESRRVDELRNELQRMNDEIIIAEPQQQPEEQEGPRPPSVITVRSSNGGVSVITVGSSNDGVSVITVMSDSTLSNRPSTPSPPPAVPPAPAAPPAAPPVRPEIPSVERAAVSEWATDSRILRLSARALVTHNALWLCIDNFNGLSTNLIRKRLIKYGQKYTVHQLVYMGLTEEEALRLQDRVRHLAP